MNLSINKETNVPSSLRRFGNRLGGRSIAAHMETSKGFTSGFDYLRFGLSLAVLFWHSYMFSYGLEAALKIASNWSGYLTYWILPMFFSLSGFLVSSSLSRSPSLKKFIWLRLIRIYPALSVEVMLSALILGPLATSLSFKEYFNDQLFYNYLLNILGWIHYELPGVFENNPLLKIVNTSLWTVPYELECYLVLSTLALIGLRKRPRLFLSLFVSIAIIRTGLTFLVPYETPNPANLGGRHLVLFFLAGVFINLFRNRIPFNTLFAAMCVCAGALCMYYYQLVLFAPLPVAYATIWLGLQQPKKIPLLMDGDYSYGIYLYAGPIQQAVWHWAWIGKTYLGNVLLSLALVSLFAAFSWHVIEKPMLRFKKYF